MTCLEVKTTCTQCTVGEQEIGTKPHREWDFDLEVSFTFSFTCPQPFEAEGETKNRECVQLFLFYEPILCVGTKVELASGQLYL